MKLGTGLPTAKFVVDFIDGNLSKAANELDANKSDIVRAVKQVESRVKKSPEL